MVKSLSSSLALSLSNDPNRRSSDSIKGLDSEESNPRCNYKAPSFAQSVYSLLTDLHDIFIDLPAIGMALVYAQKMLTDVDKGDPVDTKLLSEVHNFRIAVEGLRIALNNAARSPVNKMESAHSSNTEFPELSDEEKSHVLIAHALKNRTKKFKSVMVIVDASSSNLLAMIVSLLLDLLQLSSKHARSFQIKQILLLLGAVISPPLYV